MPSKKKKAYEPKLPKDIWNLPDGHHMGFNYGFHKQGDAIYPAPCHQDPMQEIRIKRDALQRFFRAMQAAIQDNVMAQFEALSERELGWWQSVERDLGLNPDDVAYYFDQRCFKLRKKKQEPAQPADAVGLSSE